MNTGVDCHFLLALIETVICSTFKMMWFPDVKALFLVQVGFSIGFTKKAHTLQSSLVAQMVKKVPTLDWSLRAPAGLANRGFGSSGKQF